MKTQRNLIKFILIIISSTTSIYLIIVLLILPLMKFQSTFHYSPKSVSISQEDIEAEIYFPGPNSEQKYFNLITDEIDKASYSIDIAMYSFDSDEITQKLYEAADRDVNIRLIIASHNRKEAEKLFKNPHKNITLLPSITNKPQYDHSGNMHHKFILIDYKKNPRLIMSSLNLTDIQNNHDSGHVFITQNRTVAEVFHQEFSILSNGIWGIDKLDQINYRPYAHKIETSQAFMEIWFSPGLNENSINQRILDLINEAENEVKIICWQITDEDVIDAMKKKAEDGIRFNIIIDDYIWQNAKTQFKNLEDNHNINLRTDKEFNRDTSREVNDNDEFNNYIHEHIMIVDNKIVLFGTNNWSRRAAYKNDESIIITNQQSILKPFATHFNSISGKSVD